MDHGFHCAAGSLSSLWFLVLCVCVSAHLPRPSAFSIVPQGHLAYVMLTSSFCPINEFSLFAT